MPTTRISIGGAFRASSTVKVYLTNSSGPDELFGEFTVNRAGVLIVDVPYANGETFKFEGIDNNGRYAERTYTIADTTPPDAPTDLQVNDDGTVLTGKAQPHSDIEVRDPDRRVIGTGKTDENGDFRIDLATPQTNGEELDVVARDPGGTSDAAPVTAPDLTPPEIFVFTIDAPDEDGDPNPFFLHIDEPYAYFTIRDEEGNVILSGQTDGTGRYTGNLPGGPYTQGEKFTAVPSDAAGNEGTPVDTFAPEIQICFTAGTFIETSAGGKRVEELSVGDLVRTKDNGFQPVVWIGQSWITAERIAANPHLRPICIKAGSLGADMPARDLVVSPQHRVLVSSKIAERMFRQREVLVAAKHLVGLPGIDVHEGAEGVRYLHFLTEQHDIVYANGAETETLFLGRMAKRSLSPEALAEIAEIFPDMVDTPARTFAAGRRSVKMAERHRANGLSLHQ